MFSSRFFGAQSFAARHFTGSTPGEAVVEVEVGPTLFAAGGKQRLADAIRRKKDDEAVISVLVNFITNEMWR